MANNGEQYGSQTDAYGNPVLSQTDEYGRTGTGGLAGGPHISTDTNMHGQQQHSRTGSDSSSSYICQSKDDGEGGRRKKKIGITEKIKEKLTGGQTMDQDQHQQASTTCTPAAGSRPEGSYEGAEEGEQPEAGHEKKRNDGHGQRRASWRRSPLN